MSKLTMNETVQNTNKVNKMLMNEPSQHINKQSHAAKTRQAMSARQMQKLAKNDEQVVLGVVRTLNKFVPRSRGMRGNKKRNENLLAMRE